MGRRPGVKGELELGAGGTRAAVSVEVLPKGRRVPRDGAEEQTRWNKKNYGRKEQAEVRFTTPLAQSCQEHRSNSTFPTTTRNFRFFSNGTYGGEIPQAPSTPSAGLHLPCECPAESTNPLSLRLVPEDLTALVQLARTSVQSVKLWHPPEARQTAQRLLSPNSNANFSLCF